MFSYPYWKRRTPVVTNPLYSFWVEVSCANSHIKQGLERLQKLLATHPEDTPVLANLAIAFIAWAETYLQKWESKLRIESAIAPVMTDAADRDLLSGKILD
jgi:hypothetical protein